MNSLEQLQHTFFDFLTTTFNLSSSQLKDITFDLNTDEKKADFGDITSNASLVLAKELQQKPHEVAQHIGDQFTSEAVQKIEIAGPGFLNFFLKPTIFVQLARNLFQQERTFFQPSSEYEQQQFDIEFVSANPTGPLHLGHGRGGIIGDVLGNILQFLGHKVTKEFYINDAGAQIQKLGQSFKIRCLQELGQDSAFPEDGYHGEYLKELAKECVHEYGKALLDKSDIFFEEYAKKQLLEHIKKTLHKYGIIYDVWFSEKQLHDTSAIAKEIQTLTNRGHTYTEDGALWFTSKKFGDDKDRVLQKAIGDYTYVAADVAYLQNKLGRGFDQLIMVLGQDHHSYVQRLKGIMEALGHDPDQLEIILYQLVTLKDEGKQLRMSKRAGKMTTLEDIINTVGTDVARFFYLNRKADAHLDFDIGLALQKTEENPVYYVQYALVRTKSILAKAQEEQPLHNISADDIKDLGPDEIALIKKMIELKQLLINISTNYQTHLLTYYVIELAKAFHHYYNKNWVINLDNIPQSRMRLALVILVKNTLELCLTLLGLSLPERM